MQEHANCRSYSTYSTVERDGNALYRFSEVKNAGLKSYEETAIGVKMLHSGSDTACTKSDRK